MINATLFIRGTFMVLMRRNGRWVLTPLARAWSEATPGPVGIKVVGGLKLGVDRL